MNNPLDRLKIDFQNGDRKFRPIHESWAEWMLECVPPIRQAGWSFMNSEPWTHNEEGKGIYFTSLYVIDTHYGCYCTLAEWDERKLGLIGFSDDNSLMEYKFGE